MGDLIRDMTHFEISAHLRHEVRETARFETGRLIQVDRGMSDGLAGPAFFGAVRAVMSDIDYLGALWDGWDGQNQRRIATAGKAIRFMSEVFPPATDDDRYAKYAAHLYSVYRCGTVHLRAPRRLQNQSASRPILSWTVMDKAVTEGGGKSGPGPFTFRHLEIWNSDDPNVATLPLSIEVLFTDFLRAVSYYADLIEREAAEGGTDLRHRWRSAANGMIAPEPTDLDW